MSEYKEMEIHFYGSSSNRQGALLHELTIDFTVDPEHYGAAVGYILRVARRALDNGFHAALQSIAAIDIPAISESTGEVLMEQAFEAALALVRHERQGWTGFEAFTRLGPLAPLVERQFMSGPLIFAGMEVSE